MVKSQVKLSKPRFIGATVLNVSKCVLYDFYYNHIQEMYSQAQVVFTDTDSLALVNNSCLCPSH